MSGSTSAPLALLLAVAFLGCGAEPDPERQRGMELVERVREAHGSQHLDRARLTFTFRGDRYEIERRGGRFSYTRCFDEESGRTTCDTLDNDGIVRQRGGEAVPMTDREVRSAESTLNSVVYFVLLPYNLADPAVQPRHLGSDTIRGEAYDLLEVTFRQEGGGRDWEDRFVYWIHRQRGTMDFLAYDFHSGDGGTRFREAINRREVNGALFADYINYAADAEDQLANLEEYGSLLEAGALERVSIVEKENVRFERL